MNNKLNACPFCGCLPHIDTWYTGDGVLYRVKCDNKNCPECTTWFNTCEGAAMHWNSMIGTPHSPNETGISVEFRPCPDCGYSKYPLFDRRKTYNGMSLESSVVSAFCEVCGWETQFHNNVRECAKEWNEVEI